ncbi:hypothetical protein [Streptomyces hydrogenans]|uniref:hypothetical protein n=1 Tax=Streptomyces hydrogenans TaxID=1873719 RepID=UPI0038177111
MTTTKLRPLPPFAKWGHHLFAFAHNGRTFFASRLPGGWTVVAEDAQNHPITSGHTAKASAVRAALDLIDPPTI